MMRAVAISYAVASGGARQVSFEKTKSYVRSFLSAGGHTYFSNIRWEKLLAAKLLKEGTAA